jgi:DNA modification methylase
MSDANIETEIEDGKVGAFKLKKKAKEAATKAYIEAIGVDDLLDKGDIGSLSGRVLEFRKIERLIPYARNSRTHSDEQVAQIAASIKEFGWTNPILIDDEDGIIAGHGRVLAARRLGYLEVPCITLSGLTSAQKRAYIIADNKLALNAGWDFELLKVEIDDLAEVNFDFGVTGFSQEELDALIPEQIVPGLTDEDAVPEAPEEPTTRLGDVWILGQHRLMCGDSTSIDAVERLMDGQKVDVLFTDPPYNVAFNGRSGKHDVIKNDNLEEGEFDQFIGEVLQTIKTINAPAFYIWCNWKFYSTLQRELEYKACIVWAKNVFGMGTNYRHQHEFCLFNGSIDDHIKNESDLWEVKKDTNYVHPTQKPVALSERALGNHKKAQNILDLFGGSGSTLIGCEKMGRKAFVMELDPKYCDVIVNRWQEFTGEKAILESTGKTYSETKDGV